MNTIEYLVADMSGTILAAGISGYIILAMYYYINNPEL